MKKLTDQENKDSILAGASKLFSRFGFNKTTMEEIAKSIGKSKATLYYYYNSKEDVLMDLLRKESELIFQKINSSIELHNSASERLNTYFNIITTEANNIANVYNICRFELKENFEIQKRMNEIYNDKHVSILKEIIIYGMKSKEFLGLNNSEIEEVAEFLDSVILNYIIDQIVNKQNPDWQKSLLIFGNIINKGIR